MTVAFRRKVIDDDTRTGFGDLYGRVPAVILSYGEAVATCDKLDFQPFVDRAGRLAAFYQSVPKQFDRAARAGPARTVRPESYFITDPNLATVHIYFEL